jgi:hypothetical protein
VTPVGFERFSKFFGLFTERIICILDALMVEGSVAVGFVCVWLSLISSAVLEFEIKTKL